MFKITIVVPTSMQADLLSEVPNPEKYLLDVIKQKVENARLRAATSSVTVTDNITFTSDR